MANDKNEPQSYGSSGEWVKGETGQKVHDPKSAPPPEQREFYDERRESETTAQHQGGRTSEFQLIENEQANAGSGGPTPDSSLPGKNVTSAEGGAKQDGYFKKRDYE
ncbi:MAG: hypothetical protein JO197_21345 [Acidobacteria bacterium]|nr:hypothetical protein [Acidobacteriota bacterium]MBV9475434.1 hypothetical protein [Acidobacteriota bacterium]